MKYIYADKPGHNPETHNLYPIFRLENGAFYIDWTAQLKPDEDGHMPTPDEQPYGAPTLRERLDVLEGTTDDIILMMADLIGGGE